MKHFTVVIYECVNIKVAFVLGKPLQPSILFGSKARVYPSETPSGFAFITLGRNVSPRMNTLAYSDHSKVQTKKKFEYDIRD
jgi:hypothetical protein